MLKVSLNKFKYGFYMKDAKVPPGSHDVDYAGVVEGRDEFSLGAFLRE